MFLAYPPIDLIEAAQERVMRRRRDMTDVIVRHGRTSDGVVPALQAAGFSGMEIAANIDAARNAARVILREPQDLKGLALTRALADVVEAYPDLQEVR